MSCPTEGASIAYTLEAGEKARWKLYSREIRLNSEAGVRAKACRLRYRDSAEVGLKQPKPPSAAPGRPRATPLG